MSDLLEIGALVRHPGQPDWGLGQVQSIIGDRITVNFEHAGKVVIDGRAIALDLESLDISDLLSRLDADAAAFLVKKVLMTATTRALSAKVEIVAIVASLRPVS